MSNLRLHVLFQLLIYNLSPHQTCLKVANLFGFLYKNEALTIITYEDVFMKVKKYISLISEMHHNTQFKNTLTNYTKPDLLTKRLVLLPVD